MDKSHEVLKKAIENAGAKSVANSLNLSTALIYKWCQSSPTSFDNFEASGAANPLDRIKNIYEATGDIEIINWLCRAANGFYVPNPTPENDETKLDRELFNHSKKLIREFSETLDALSRAFSHESQIDEDEATLIRKEWEDLKRTGESLVSACEEGYFLKNKNGDPR